MRKEVPESINFADDIPICAGKQVDMTEYLDKRITLLEGREKHIEKERERDKRERERGGMRVSWPKSNFTDFAFEHNEQGIRESGP